MTAIVVDTRQRRLCWPEPVLELPCAIGRAGACAASDKREGDGKTPLGTYALRWAGYRADRLDPPSTGLPLRALKPQDGWCDAPQDPAYNCYVRHPYPASAEQLWRDDGLYDLLVVLGHNDAPVVSGLGSAIFLHCALPDDRGGLKPTAGCAAVPCAGLLALLARLHPDDVIVFA